VSDRSSGAGLGRWRGQVSLVLLNLLALGGALWLSRDPRETMVRIEPAPTAVPAPTPTPVRLHVYVTGAVARPDVVELPEGARVTDAVAACGGLRPEADPDAVNLAAALADGEQVHVPVLGEAARPVIGAGGATGAPAAGGGRAAGGGAASAAAGSGIAGTNGGVIDLNTATAVDLDTLPGIGPALAARIIAYRDANGPFAVVDDLTAVSGVGDKTLERFRDRVRVR
jgi:competence protein ComEA